MGWEHEAETVWLAQELYCHNRLSFDAVARETGVAASTLKRWAEKNGWRALREELAKTELEIRANKVKARAKIVQSLLDTPRADLAFAVSSLETLALKEAEARQAAIVSSDAPPALSITSAADALAALRKAIEQKLALLLIRPENVDLRKVQEVHKCLELQRQLEAEAHSTENPEAKSGGISADLAARIEAAMTGEL